ncbi:hypothetical protein CHGG_05318 [Chaetomium globosum CBS 148.51]|uniref:Sorting nexin MVP1 n=1 Tax=Chaetomium globosum (strain ATCC 6205 / CBS 148.51 / DSM 1962 / NBRC 6347 / NRRL 1970) TaxID=306901 RepID=Q2H7P7_CHAGB|nr:uncharacterized protein CHGG_05318 [Chaetomium globosum CBS 148.51]EAQ88699.1 hypothetical protein CHGG_05318 [Chaetomium globosum CBS 148.51]
MSLFGSSPSDESPDLRSSNFPNSRSSLFDHEPPMTKSTTSALFADDDPGSDSPWDMPPPRRQQTRADVIRRLLPASDVPDAYIVVFDKVVAEDGRGGRITAGGVARTLAAAKLGADAQARIMAIVAQGGSGEEVSLDRNQFNVLLALIGLAQEGEGVSLDGVDERRRDLPQPTLHGLIENRPGLPHLEELAAKPPQQTATPPRAPEPASPARHRSVRKPSMDYPEDPWNSPDLHRNHNHGPELPRPNGHDRSASAGPLHGGGFGTSPQATLPRRTTSTFTTSVPPSGAGSVTEAPTAWGYLDPNPPAAAEFNAPPSHPTAPFGGIPPSAVAQEAAAVQPPTPAINRTIGGGRNGAAVEEHVLVTLMPEKEGVFFFQHHNYEVTSSRRGSKVVRRYSDFVWLLDCLHKRYPFRVLPLLPPKRVAVNGNHLSNDGAFIEKRRRGLARFLNTLVRHPVLGQEQLVIMFLTVPTELAVWRKQATISVLDEFAGRPLPPGLEDSLPPTLEELFARTRAGVKRERRACDEPPPADRAELIEDEARAWESGVLEDLKRQRDALVSLRELFDRRERLDKDNIPYLEKRIAANETKLSSLRAKPEGLVKPGEVEKVVEAIIKDKESIVNQHNRSVFVQECVRDELSYFQHTQYNVSRWNQDWAQERVKYSELLADNWRRLLDGLEGMPLGD